MKIKPWRKRRKVIREYDNVPILLRKLFTIQDDEMIIDFEWDKNENVLRLTTLKDYDAEVDI